MSNHRGSGGEIDESADGDRRLTGAIDANARARQLPRYALIRYRVRVEIEWYLSLAANPAIDAMPAIGVSGGGSCTRFTRNFDCHARRVKALIAETNHDVKA
jgi:adenylosuccinate lyase